MAKNAKQKDPKLPTKRKLAERDEQQSPSLKTPKSTTKKMITSSKGRINDLPNSIVQHILSFLPIRDAIKICSLSKQWNCLWTSIPNLVFEPIKPETLPDFAAFVDKVLKAYASSKVMKFSMESFNGYGMQDQIYSWLRFVTTHEVEELCWHRTGGTTVFPELLYTNHSVWKISLTKFNFVYHDDYSFCWTSLKVLTLSETHLGGESIKLILQGSPSIECLKFRQCKLCDRWLVAGDNNSMIDASNCTSLKELVIDSCSNYHFGGWIEIRGPNLLSLTVMGFMGNTKLKLGDVSSLVEANIGFWMGLEWRPGELKLLVEHKKMLKGVLQKLHHVNKLAVGTWCIEVVSVMKLEHEIFRTSRCKILKMNVKLDKMYLPGIAVLVQSSLYLEQLIINVTPLDHSNFKLADLFEKEHLAAEDYWTSEKRTFKCLNQHLKNVEIMGVVTGPSSIQDKILIELVQFILANGKVLQKLTIQEQADNQSPSLKLVPNKKLTKLLQITEKLLCYPRASPNAMVLFKNRFHPYC